MDPNVHPQQSGNPPPVQSYPQHVSPGFPLPKILLSILGVVVILGLIGGVYYLGIQKNKSNVSNEKAKDAGELKMVTPITTKTPTSAQNLVVDWKTYSSTKYGYSFQYSENWYLYPPQKTTTDLDLQTVSPASYTTRDTDGVPAGDYIDVSVDDNPKNLSIQEWAKQQLQIPIKLTTRTINGIVWYRTSDYPFYIGGEAAFTIQNGKVFDIAWTKTGKKLSISPNEFDEILSSFKFN